MQAKLVQETNPVSRRWLTGKQLLSVVIALVLFTGLLSVFGEMKVSYGPFALRLNFDWGWPGESRLVIPPLGEIKAFTHRGPVILSATLDRIDLSLLQHELLGVTETSQYLNGFILRVKESLYLFLVKLCLVGGVAGLATTLMLGERRFSQLWRMVLVGVLAVLLLMSGVLFTFDENTLSNPRYEGALEAAPWILSLIDQGLTRLPEFSEKLSLVAGNLNSLFAQVDTLSPLAQGDGELKVLHVSDIHNNPAAVELIQKVIDGFGVDLVIDTGDLTDYGTKLEAEINRKINNLGVKYLFIPGNHDSPEVISRLRKYKNVIVMTERIYHTNGLTIMGWADPAARDAVSLMLGDEEQANAAQELTAYLEGYGGKIDLLAVHNRKVAAQVEGRVPVVLHGHTHQAGISESGSSVVVNAGTTGAAGLRGLTTEALPYSVALLRFNGSEGEYRLAAVDLIRVFNLHGKFSLERKVINQPVVGDVEN